MSDPFYFTKAAPDGEHQEVWARLEDGHEYLALHDLENLDEHQALIIAEAMNKNLRVNWWLVRELQDGKVRAWKRRFWSRAQAASWIAKVEKMEHSRRFGFRRGIAVDGPLAQVEWQDETAGEKPDE